MLISMSTRHHLQELGLLYKEEKALSRERMSQDLALYGWLPMVDTQLLLGLSDGLLLHPPMMTHGMFSTDEEGACGWNIYI